MSPKSIGEIEKLVGKKLPRAYADLLLNYPKQLAKAFPKDRAADETELFGDSKSILSINRMMRRADHLIDPDDRNSTWPPHYLIIGMDVGANLYCMKLVADRPPVYFWFHETNEFEKYAKNLDEFVTKLIAKYA